MIACHELRTPKGWRNNARGGGVLTYLAERGCAALMVAFLQEILKHGSHFLPQKSLNMGQLFWLSPKLRDFRGFRMAKTPKIADFLKKKAYFWRKILKNWYPFWPKSPLKMGMGLRLERHTPVQLKSEYPPPRKRFSENCHADLIDILQPLIPPGWLIPHFFF